MEILVTAFSQGKVYRRGSVPHQEKSATMVLVLSSILLSFSISLSPSLLLFVPFNTFAAVWFHGHCHFLPPVIQGVPTLDQLFTVAFSFSDSSEV